MFGVGEDPVRLGLVASLARPGGNATGVNFFTGEVAAKRLGLLRELLPGATRDRRSGQSGQPFDRKVHGERCEGRRHRIGVQIRILNAGTIREIDTAYASLVRERADALVVAGDRFFHSRRVQLAMLAVRHAVPDIPGTRVHRSGRAVSYGASLTDTNRQAGVYVGRILKGEKPSDLPVQTPTKFELVINLKTAKMLGLEVPPTLLARADEVIE